MNKIHIIGNAGRDPELTFTTSGITVCSFSLADNYKTKDGNKTEWHRCVAFDKKAEIINQYVAKGDKVYIEGRIQTDTWTDKDGVVRYMPKVIVSEVHLLGNKKTGVTPNPAPNDGKTGSYVPTMSAEGSNDYSDDIPF